MSTPIDGRALGAAVLFSAKQTFAKSGKKPLLAVVLVGNDPASHTYVGLKQKAALRVGIGFEKITLPASATGPEIIGVIENFNNRPDVTGILVQLPLPEHLSQDQIVQKVTPLKDADAFLGKNKLVPPPVAATLLALKSTGQDFNNKQAALRVNSTFFGRALKSVLKPLGLKVTIILPTQDESLVKTADVVVSARGTPGAIKEIKPGAIVIDIGTAPWHNKIVGDFAPEALAQSSFYTPVPGGIGPMTVALLIKNVVDLA